MAVDCLEILHKNLTMSNLNLFETCELVVFVVTAVGTEKEGMLNGQS